MEKALQVVIKSIILFLEILNLDLHGNRGQYFP